MPSARLHRFEENGKRFVIDPETCFCFECDAVSWDVLEHYPAEPVNRILHLLDGKHPAKEIEEVVGELEWLRASKSILLEFERDTLPKRYETKRGLKRVTVLLPARDKAEEPVRYDTAHQALDLLLAGAWSQEAIHFEVVAPADGVCPGAFQALADEAFRRSGQAAKKLTLSLLLEPFAPSAMPAALDAHALALEIRTEAGDNTTALIPPWNGQEPPRLADTVEWLAQLESDVSGTLVLRPANADFASAVKAAVKAGFERIALDLAAPYAQDPAPNPDAMTATLRAVAHDYAEDIRRGKLIRLDPIAPLFLQIYEGRAEARADPSGSHALAVDAQGTVYPGFDFVGQQALALGSLGQGHLDESLHDSFANVGALTTSDCLNCWARNLCGGGPAAVHQALTGNFRQPHPPWCGAQRAWFETAVAAFNRLSDEGVDFSRIYAGLARAKRPSWFTMLRAAFRQDVGLRPIAERDAPWLAQWENWSEAAYFLFNESGLMMATEYDREMDALHPRGIDQEFVIVRKNGRAMGLIKVRPDRFPGTAQAWLYLRDPKDYANGRIQRSLAKLIEQAAGQQNIRRLLVPAGPKDEGLSALLEAADFTHAGNLRQALFLHGTYHDVALHSKTIDPKA